MISTRRFTQYVLSKLNESASAVWGSITGTLSNQTDLKNALDSKALAPQIDGADAKTTLSDTDTFALTEPTTLKKTLWSTIKSTLKTYFDGLYLALTGGTLTGQLTINNNIQVDNAFIGSETYSGSLTVRGIGKSYTFKVNSDASFGSLYIGSTNTSGLTFGVKSGQGFWESLRALINNLQLSGTFVAGQDAHTSGWTSVPIRPGHSLGNANNINGVDLVIQGGQGTGTGSGGNIRFQVKSADGSGSQGLTVLSDALIISGINGRYGRIGIGTTAPDKQLEINSVDGNCLRLTYNDANGSATYYADLTVDSSGNLTVNASGGLIKTANDVEIIDSSKGLILKSPNGTRYRVTVNDSGNLITTQL